MPLATRPNQTYEIVLSTDSEQPKGKEPAFVFRYMSTLEWEEIAELNDRFEKTADSRKMLDLAFAVIRKTLCGWRNMIKPNGKEIPFALNKLKSMVSLGEAVELMQAAVSQRPSFEDKKKFGSPSQSSTPKSAKTAKG